MEARTAALPAIIAKMGELAKSASMPAEEERYGPIIGGHLEQIKAVFDTLDRDASGLLDRAELEKVVAKYNGEAFDAAQFFAWFDVHGSNGPDEKLDLKEFGWSACAGPRAGPRAPACSRVLPRAAACCRVLPRAAACCGALLAAYVRMLRAGILPT